MNDYNKALEDINTEIDEYISHFISIKPTGWLDAIFGNVDPDKIDSVIVVLNLLKTDIRKKKQEIK